MISLSKLRTRAGLIVLLIIIAAIAISLYLVYQNQDIRKKAQVSLPLSLKPNQGTFLLGDEISVNIDIDSGSSSIAGVDLKIKYDPRFLTGKSIINGFYFNDPFVIVPGSFSDGVARIVLGTKPGTVAKGIGTLAIIKFQALVAGQAAVSFDPGTKISTVETGSVPYTSMPASYTICKELNKKDPNKCIGGQGKGGGKPPR